MSTETHIVGTIEIGGARPAEDPYIAGRKWAMANTDPSVPAVHFFYMLLIKFISKKDRGRQFRESDFPPHLMRMVLALAVVHRKNAGFSALTTNEEAVSFLNGVRDGFWTHNTGSPRTYRRARASSAARRSGVHLTTSPCAVHVPSATPKH